MGDKIVDNGGADDSVDNPTAPVIGVDTDTPTEPNGGDWLQALEEPYRKDPNLTKFKSQSDLAKSYLNQLKLVGANKVVLPGEKATPEEWNQFFEKIGRPKDSSGYKFDHLPEELRHESNEKIFAEVFHKAGLTPKQAEVITQAWAELSNAELSRMQESQGEMAKKAETVLRKEWGMAYNQNLQLASKVVKQFGDPEALEALEAVGNHPAVLKMFAKLGKQLAEDGIVGRPAGDTLSPEEAHIKIKELQNHPGYLDGNHPEHKLIVKKLEGLFSMKYANAKG